MVLVVMFVVVLGATLLLGIYRVGSGQKEREDQEGQKDELVVENEHDGGCGVGTVVVGDKSVATVVGTGREMRSAERW